MVLLATATACASSEPDAESPPAAVEGSSSVAPGLPCQAPTPLPAAAATAAPVALPPGALLTDVREQAGQRLVTGRTPAPVGEVLDHFRAVEGHVVVRDEDEGRSGRLLLFGAGGDVAVTVARQTCPRGTTGFTLATVGKGVTQQSPAG